MSQQQPVRVIVEHKRSSSGCGAALLVLIAIGLPVKYWYVSVAIVVMVVVLGVVANQDRNRRHVIGPATGPVPRPWLNDVAAALSDLGLAESARNNGHHLGGVPLEGDIDLEGTRLTVYVDLFGDGELARQAEFGPRANASTRESVTAGRCDIKRTDRVLYVANGQHTPWTTFASMR